MYIKKILLIIVALGLIAGGIFSYYIYNSILGPNTSFKANQVPVFISKIDNPQQVLNKIKPFLKDVKSFDWLAKKKGYYSNIKTGKYILNKDASNNDIITTLRSKNTPIDVDSLELLDVLKDKDFLKKNNFTDATALSMYIPNSYEVFWNTSAEGFRKRMLREYLSFWNSSKKAKAKKIGLTPNEVYTLASIVHKETVKPDERPRVAGVYMNRLIHGMKLDADPTVIYSIKKTTKNWNQTIKRVLFKDLKIQNPYNTYQNKGVTINLHLP